MKVKADAKVMAKAKADTKVTAKAKADTKVKAKEVAKVAAKAAAGQSLRPNGISYVRDGLAEVGLDVDEKVLDGNVKLLGVIWDGMEEEIWHSLVREGGTANGGIRIEISGLLRLEKVSFGGHVESRENGRLSVAGHKGVSKAAVTDVLQKGGEGQNVIYVKTVAVETLVSLD